MFVDSVTPTFFATWVRRKRFAVLFLGDGVRVPRPPGVVEGLERTFPGQLSIGWMNRELVHDDSWWERHFRTSFGPIGRGRPPQAGVYAFFEGEIATHSPATASAGTAETWHAVRDHLRERLQLKAQAGQDTTEWTTRGGRADPGRKQGSEEPPRARARGSLGPYELLEVDPEADDAEVKRAYRRALLLNHPDKCANLSRAIQEFARERTQLLVAAWEAVKEERGIR